MTVALITTEADFTSQIVDLCRYFKWRVVHFRPARTGRGWRTTVQGDGTGWPDIVAVRGDRIVVAELKSQHGRVTPEQTAWLEAFAAAGAETFVWRPADFDQAVGTLR